MNIYVITMQDDENILSVIGATDNIDRAKEMCESLKGDLKRNQFYSVDCYDEDEAFRYTVGYYRKGSGYLDIDKIMRAAGY